MDTFLSSLASGDHRSPCTGAGHPAIEEDGGLTIPSHGGLVQGHEFDLPQAYLTLQSDSSMRLKPASTIANRKWRGSSHYMVGYLQSRRNVHNHSNVCIFIRLNKHECHYLQVESNSKTILSVSAVHASRQEPYAPWLNHNNLPLGGLRTK